MQKHKISLEHAQKKIVVPDRMLDCDVHKTPRQAECALLHMWEHEHTCISLVSTTKSEGVRPERHMESNVTLNEHIKQLIF